jgi:hypothetical protein
MPISAVWDDEAHTIIRLDVRGAWTWEEYYDTLQQVEQMMQGVTHRVDMINVRHADAQMPAGTILPHIERAMRSMMEQLGIRVSVGSNVYSRTIRRVLTALRPDQMRGRMFDAPTLDAARKLIADERKKTETN